MCRGHFLTACIGLLLNWYHHGLSIATEPGFLDFDNLPETNFSCEGKVIGGYYADTETGCQMFHVCTIGQKGEVTDIKFLCLNGTVFDQETRVCERLDEVDCSKSESFYDLNLELYGNNPAGFGIQPESEDVPETLCEEEEEEECKTEKPEGLVKTPTEQAQVSSVEKEEETTTQPSSSSTTSRRPVTSTSFPSTTPTPQILQFPSSSPETIAALLALHNAFTQSLQQHANSKDKINPPKITGFVESLNREKATQEAQTFEIKNGQTFSSRVPTPFPSKTQTQYVPQSSSKPQFQNPPETQFQNPQKPQFTPLKPQFQNPPKTLYQSPPKTQFQSQPKPQYQPPKPPVTHPPTFPKLHTTSERFGNLPFRHSFHINSQVTHFHEPNYQDQYSDHESQPSSQPQTEAPKQYDFGDYEDDYYDEKPHSSTITPYLLHQLKVNQVQSASQAKVSESSNHGSFVREVSSSSSKPFNVPSYRSVTTPEIAIITATSTTSSSSVKTGKPLQSAIQQFKKNPTGSGYVDSLFQTSNSSDTEHYVTGPQSYDDYKEGDVRSDPFYKDVPKISRSKRNIVNDVDKENSVTTVDYTYLRKLKGKLLNSMFKLNSEDVLHAILGEYCNSKVNSSDLLLNYCANNNHKSSVSDYKSGDEWEIVLPKENKDFLYLVKTISSSTESENSTSNILLLVHFPSEFKSIRDSIIKGLEDQEHSNKLLKDVQVNSLNSSIHHRFKRVKRENFKGDKRKRSEMAMWKKYLKKVIPKLKRSKRQTQSSPSYKSSEGGSVSGSYDSPRVRPVVRGRESHTRENQQRSRTVVRKRPQFVEQSEETGTQPIHQRPTQRRLPTSRTVPVRPVLPVEEEEEINAQKESHTFIVPPRRKPSRPQAPARLPIELEEQNYPHELQNSRPSANITQRRQPSRPEAPAQLAIQQEQNYPPEFLQNSRPANIPQRRQPNQRLQPSDSLPETHEPSHTEEQFSRHPLSDSSPISDKTLGSPSAGRRKQGTKYHFCEGPQCFKGAEKETLDDEVEVSTTYPFNLKPGTTFNCDDKIKGGYYADVEAECYGYFICSQGAINGPLLKSHFWCGPTTKFNQRSRTCQAEANVACSVSHRYYHLNKDILSLPDPDDLVRDSFEPSKVKS
ncbi:uncharacterized protein LOC128994041 isoform X2 [Macrosteles quadrilineatus]|uniref:uncharacterized protein LOC128994041 isoform X2 n=1 Tax=Macrosteles quadrilineatus TaxID=74068 RepID=UPI0023E2E1AF|nr:uncharacterized protein LOC128994041 isoform X2 [Macrosteles quadrilineatus]